MLEWTISYYHTLYNFMYFHCVSLILPTARYESITFTTRGEYRASGSFMFRHYNLQDGISFLVSMILWYLIINKITTLTRYTPNYPIHTRSKWTVTDQNPSTIISRCLYMRLICMHWGRNQIWRSSPHKEEWQPRDNEWSLRCKEKVVSF